MGNFTALIAGMFFGAGLFTSGMTDTAKVQGWLDIFGGWDPTLAFVLTGAILPMAVAWRIAARREKSLTNGAFPDVSNRRIDRKLIIGSMVFGAGWALSGLCPGPSLASITYGDSSLFIFLAALVAGMLVAPKFSRLL